MSTGLAHSDLLTAADRARLERHAERAVRRARKRGECLVALIVALPGETDPTAVVVASRRPGEPWTVLEQPERAGAAIATLGCATALDDAGLERFTSLAKRWRALASTAVCDPPDLAGAGPIATGGMAFDPRGSAAPHWASFPSASLHVPEVAIVRRNGDVRLTLTALARPDDDPAGLAAKLERRAGELRFGTALPLWDPDPAGARARVVSAMPPEHYEAAVARAVERIQAGDFSKIVLAREVQVHAPAAHDPAAVVGVLREAFPSCHVLCIGRGDVAFLAASPELLVRREGMRAGTLALAGSTRRSADPAVDDHLGEQLLRSSKDREEQAIVVRRIERTLRPHSVWITHAEEPILVRIANIQHLGTPIRAQLSRPVGALELAGLLHPTPAVGGEPHAEAVPQIPALEGLDRGWYAGPIGWTDVHEDGEFVVALRCALLEGRVARCFAGVGVVTESDPAAELAETEIKLQALLPVLAG